MAEEDVGASKERGSFHQTGKCRGKETNLGHFLGCLVLLQLKSEHRWVKSSLSHSPHLGELPGIPGVQLLLWGMKVLEIT